MKSSATGLTPPSSIYDLTAPEEGKQIRDLAARVVALERENQHLLERNRDLERSLREEKGPNRNTVKWGAAYKKRLNGYGADDFRPGGRRWQGS